MAFLTLMIAIARDQPQPSSHNYKDQFTDGENFLIPNDWHFVVCCLELA